MMIVTSVSEDVRQSKWHSVTIRVCNIVCQSYKALNLRSGSLPNTDALQHWFRATAGHFCAGGWWSWISGKHSSTEDSAVTYTKIFPWMFVCHPVGMLPYIKRACCKLSVLFSVISSYGRRHHCENSKHPFSREHFSRVVKCLSMKPATTIRL